MALMRLNIKASRLPNALLLMSPLLMRESMASSAIENIHTTMEDVIQAELLPDKERQGPAKEVLHYRDAMERGLELVRKNNRLTVDDMIALQKIVEPTKTGLRTSKATIRNGSTGEVLYTPPEGEASLRQLLKNLEQYINAQDEHTDPLIRMAVMHYQFEAIHPFPDGNGRIGRIMMILSLVLWKRIDHPILFLSGFTEQNKNAYYKLLREITATRNFTPLVLFFLEGVRAQADEGTSTVGKIEELMQHYEKKMAGALRVSAHELTQVLFSRPLLTIDYIQEQLGLSARQTASKYLSTLTEMGLLHLQTVGLQKTFYIPPFLALLG